MASETQRRGRVTDLEAIERPKGVPKWCSAFMDERGIVYLWDGRMHVDAGKHGEHVKPALVSMRGARMTEAGLYPSLQQMAASGFKWPTDAKVAAKLATMRS